MSINKKCLKDVLKVVLRLSGSAPVIVIHKSNYAEFYPLGKYKYDDLADVFRYCELNKLIYINRKYVSFDYYNSLIFSKITKEGFDELNRLDKPIKSFFVRYYNTIVESLFKIVSFFK